jgi:hypothetical protein
MEIRGRKQSGKRGRYFLRSSYRPRDKKKTSSLSQQRLPLHLSPILPLFSPHIPQNVSNSNNNPNRLSRLRKDDSPPEPPPPTALPEPHLQARAPKERVRRPGNR